MDPDAHMGKRRNRDRPRYVPDDPLLSAAEAAVERGQARSSFWKAVKLGRVPPGYYVSDRCRRWYRSELHADVRARPARTAG